MDRETVITHLQIIHTWAEFARERDLQFFTAKHLEDIAQWSDDALELLKEQEAQSVLSNRECEAEPFRYVRKGFCPKCHQEMEWLFNRNHCGFCGQAVKWE